MKAKLVLSILLVAALALVGTGCNKVTGGGWFNDVRYGKVTFGFNAQPTEAGMDLPPGPIPWPLSTYPTIDAKGQFQLVAHGTEDYPKMKIHGTFTGTYAYIQPENSAYFSGTCLVNGTETKDFYIVYFGDDFPEPQGTPIKIGIGTTDPMANGSDIITLSGTLGGGTLKVHKAKKK